MPEYLPYAGTNAIQEVVIGVHFQNNFSPSDVANVRLVAETELKDVFPQSKDIHGMQLEMEGMRQEGMHVKGVSSRHLTGFQMIKTGSDGNPSRILQMEAKFLTMHFMKYGGWNATRDDGLEYISTILRHLDLESNALQQFSLRYIDRFTFDGAPDDAKASDLISAASSFVTKQCFDVGPLWHCHSGWFKPLGNSRILNQLNIDSGTIGSASTATVTIDHNLIFQMGRSYNNKVASFLSSSGGEGEGFKATLNDLHDMNHAVLSDILLPDMSQRIGLAT